MLPRILRNDPGSSPAIEWRVDRKTTAALLGEVSSTWARLGKERPHWSVLAADQFLPENIPGQLDVFYASGAADAALILETLARLGREPAQFGTFFEFGCGLGRVTSHVHKHFRRVLACDISPSHLAIARTVLQQRGIANVELRQATVADFGMSERFDLWFSRLVLQHNTPPLIAQILKRALRLLRPGGIALFQVPTDAPGYRFSVAEYLENLGRSDSFEMHALPQHVILECAARARCALLEMREDGMAGPPWTSMIFAFQKRKPVLWRLGERASRVPRPALGENDPLKPRAAP